MISFQVKIFQNGPTMAAGNNNYTSQQMRGHGLCFRWATFKIIHSGYPPLLVVWVTLLAFSNFTHQKPRFKPHETSSSPILAQVCEFGANYIIGSKVRDICIPLWHVAGEGLIQTAASMTNNNIVEYSLDTAT